MTNAFNARFVSNFTPDRLYRVTVERGEIYFIKVGGQGGLSLGVTSQFGILGVFIQRLLDRRREEKLAARVDGVDRMHPSSQLSAHKHNLHAAATSIETSSLEPPAKIPGHGPHVGRWKLKLRDGKPMLFQLETFDEMRTAHELLPTLGTSHRTNVVYDANKMKFVPGP